MPPCTRKRSIRLGMASDPWPRPMVSSRSPKRPVLEVPGSGKSDVARSDHSSRSPATPSRLTEALARFSVTSRSRASSVEAEGGAPGPSPTGTFALSHHLVAAAEPGIEIANPERGRPAGPPARPHQTRHGHEHEPARDRPSGRVDAILPAWIIPQPSELRKVRQRRATRRCPPEPRSMPNRPRRTFDRCVCTVVS